MGGIEQRSGLRPELVFRVGVTGHRELHDAGESLRKAVEMCLTLVRDEIARLANDPAAQRVYRNSADGMVRFKLQVVSPLADGADRLVAEQGIATDAKLYAPSPVRSGSVRVGLPRKH